MLLLLYHICNIFSRAMANWSMIWLCNHRDWLLPQISIVTTCFLSQLTKMVCLFRIGRHLLPLWGKGSMYHHMLIRVDEGHFVKWRQCTYQPLNSFHGSSHQEDVEWKNQENIVPDCYSITFLLLSLSLSPFSTRQTIDTQLLTVDNNRNPQEEKDSAQPQKQEK